LSPESGGIEVVSVNDHATTTPRPLPRYSLLQELDSLRAHNAAKLQGALTMNEISQPLNDTNPHRTAAIHGNTNHAESSSWVAIAAIGSSYFVAVMSAVAFCLVLP
jgi:hypothetical protein